VFFVFHIDSFAKGFSWVGSVAAPIICGIVIAYILNPLVMLLENKVFFKLKNNPPPEEGIVIKQLHKTPVGSTAVVKQLEKHSPDAAKKRRRRVVTARVLSIVIAYLIVIAAVVGIVVAVVPSVASSIVDLTEKMPGYVNNLENFLKETFDNNPEIASLITDEFDDLNDLVNKLTEYVKPYATGWLGNFSTGFFSAVSAVFTGTKNVVLGLIIAIYFLFSKERLLAQIKKIFFAFFKNETCGRIFSACSRSNRIFTKYIVSNLLDSLIVFTAMVIGCLIMGMPYPMLISVVCGITNLIPFFGPFIGAIPCGLLILLVNPVKVIWFAIFVLVLQQVDGNVIKPVLFGETIGLPAIWVLISITVGGGMFGIPGMILGAPVFAVFYLLFAEFVTNRLKKKNLPHKTDDYTEDIEHFTKDYINRAEKSADDSPQNE
jgi:predicted PurR-regulated permease PerM